jgi:uncharacterized membrane protein (DUF2068 family)
MGDPAAVPKILRTPQRVRYLKGIAVFKILHGLLLLALGFSLVFLNSRTRWLEQISKWTEEELLLHHSRAVLFLLSKLQDALAGGYLRATAILALFYAAILFIEGFGVYFQKRWAEFLMVFATGALIPLEVHHIWHRPSIAAVVILLVNCFIVWFLYRVLQRETHRSPARLKAEVTEPR